MVRPVPFSGLLLVGLLSLPLTAKPPATPADHCRVLPAAGLLPRAVSVLMDHDYVIRSASADLGVICFAKVFQSERYSIRHAVQVEGSLALQPGPAGMATVRLLIHQAWTSSGEGTPAEMGVETDTDAAYYLEIFKALEAKN